MTKIRELADLGRAIWFDYVRRFFITSGQLHKGDVGNGLFIQFTADDLRDVPIPTRPERRTRR